MSPATKRYNCIAWSVGDTLNWWWPDAWDMCAWFDGIPRNSSIEAFKAGFSSLGYVDCADGSLELGIEKIVLYAAMSVVDELEVTHAAFQEPDGKWSSKLGVYQDIVWPEPVKPAH